MTTATTIDLPIQGMDCGSCALTVERALAGVEGVQSAKVEWALGKATVRGMGLVRRHLDAAVRAAGFVPVRRTWRAILANLG